MNNKQYYILIELNNQKLPKIIRLIFTSFKHKQCQATNGYKSICFS